MSPDHGPAYQGETLGESALSSIRTVDKQNLSALKRSLEFHIAYHCTDACMFCYVDSLMREFSFIPIDYKSIIRILVEEKAKGFNEVMFTGGEPTLYPKLLEIITVARKVGYSVGIISNGARLSDSEYAAVILPQIDALCLSIRGPNAMVHDQIACHPGSFEKLERALNNLDSCAKPPFIVINHVITRLNCPLLKQTIEFIGRTKQVKKIIVSTVAPEDSGKRRYGQLAVRHEEIVLHLPALISIAHKMGVTLKILGIPLCLLAPYGAYSGDLFPKAHTIVKRTRLSDYSIGWHFSPSQPQRRYYPKSCSGCVLKKHCCGVYWEYEELFGSEGLTPFNISSLHQAFHHKVPLP